MKAWLESRKKVLPFVCAILLGEALPFLGMESLVKEGWGVHTIRVLIVAAILAGATELLSRSRK